MSILELLSEENIGYSELQFVDHLSDLDIQEVFTEIFDDMFSDGYSLEESNDLINLSLSEEILTESIILEVSVADVRATQEVKNRLSRIRTSKDLVHKGKKVLKDTSKPRISKDSRNVNKFGSKQQYLKTEKKKSGIAGVIQGIARSRLGKLIKRGVSAITGGGNKSTPIVYQSTRPARRSGSSVNYSFDSTPQRSSSPQRTNTPQRVSFQDIRRARRANIQARGGSEAIRNQRPSTPQGPSPSPTPAASTTNINNTAGPSTPTTPTPAATPSLGLTRLGAGVKAATATDSKFGSTKYETQKQLAAYDKAKAKMDAKARKAAEARKAAKKK